MDSVVVKQTLLEQINNFSSLNTIIETIMVDDSIGNLDFIKTRKENEKIVSFTDKIFYKLKSTRLLIKSDKEFQNNIIISDVDDQVVTNNRPLCECIARNTNIIIAKEFNKLKTIDSHRFKFFSQSFFEKLFSFGKTKKLNEKILDLSTGFTWMIIPKSLTSVFTDNKNFEKNEVDCENIIHLFGKFNGINVFINPDQKENKIYFGNYESLIFIINKNLEIKDTKSLNSIFTNSTSITVHYSLIQNSPLSVLELY